MTEAELLAAWASCRATVWSMTGTWRHYKGSLVTVLGPCMIETTCEPGVECLHNGIKWARSLSVWNEEVVVDGKMVPRYVRVAT